MISLTATELPRFLACNGSLLLEGVKTLQEDDTLRQEGIAAHWLVQQVVDGGYSLEELIDRKASNGVYIDEDMVENCRAFCDQILKERTVGHAYIEKDTSWSGSTFEIRGRADNISHTPDALIIRDFKYGWKIVEPENNWTLISHAIGYLAEHRIALLSQNIVFEIYQPRPYHPKGHVRQWVISHETLLNLWNHLLGRLSDPNNILNTGPQCYKCPSFTQCPATQIALMNAIDVSETAFNNVIDDKELAWMLNNIERATEVLSQAKNAYEDLALHRIKSGRNVQGYSVHTGLGKTKWKEGVTPEFVELITGKDVSKKELKTPNQSKKAGVLEDVVESLTFRPSTGIKLVRMDVSKKAELLFGRKE